MKKSILKLAGIVTITLALFFDITGCGTKSTSSRAKNSDESANVDINHNDQIISPSDISAYTLQEVCEGYLNNDPTYEYCYEADDEYRGWIWVSIGPGIEFIAPGAVYSKEEWTPEEVLQSFKDGTEPWAGIINDFGDEYYCLWSQNYETKFCVEDGWLRIDGIESLPANPQTYSMDPAELIAAYQSGEWDGEKDRYSEDYGTRAHISADGRIQYVYQRYEYTKSGDPKQVSYQDYGVEPAFRPYADEVCADDNNTTTHVRCNDELEHDESAHAASDPTTRLVCDPVSSFSITEDDCKIVYEGARSKAYVDLPNQTSSYDVLDIVYTDDGTYVLTRSATYLYRRGHRIYTWETGESTHGELITICDGRIWAYLHDRAELVPLDAGGFTGEVLGNIASRDWGYDDEYLEVATIQDGKLDFYHYEFGDNRELLGVANNVLEVKCLYSSTLLYSTEGDSVYALNTYNGNAYYLGDGELDGYYNLLNRQYLVTSDISDYIKAHQAELD